ncbi:hypothetical protein [Halobellus ruber]|uniref:Uncharacterized protein n=1 Tax=Halobellus ruber TaxID=2761102 RepID=A0A7J9SFF6_9EURY|nr:hypothetical protein [Halobellus ruber]MBB6644707.1 hypothetical protein [Halobellus ruber]
MRVRSTPEEIPDIPTDLADKDVGALERRSDGRQEVLHAEHGAEGDLASPVGSSVARYTTAAWPLKEAMDRVAMLYRAEKQNEAIAIAKRAIRAKILSWYRRRIPSQSSVVEFECFH